ncbi:MAG: amino acid adenylation domain-containing protein, partial [Bacteroidota bacterium]|nr:amino acid adenylation domain-containing protein [Bacteroidota bacterium]
MSVIEKAPRQQQELKLSFSQQRLWFIEKLRPGGSSYNIPAAIKIKGKFSTDVLKMALNDMIDRHEILRTFFMEKGGRPYLNITEKYTSEVEIIDISEIEDERMLQSKVEEIIDSLNAFSFDLSNLPLFKFAVITLNENEHIFVAVMHHIITDGWSVGIFFNELKLLYEKHQGISVKLPELPLQYSDYAQWQQKLMSDELFLKEIQYWKDQLSDIPQMLNLPVDKTRPSVQTTNGDSKTLFISEGLRQKLQKLSIDRGATLFMVMLSAFKLLMHKYSGQDDIVIGSPIAGRIQTGLEGLIGFFVNNIALRCRFENIKTFNELIENTRKVTLEAYKNQHVPFERLVEELQPERNLSHLPIFQVMFVFQNLPFDVKRSYDISLEAMPIKNKTSNFDISMIITEAMGGLNVEVEYNTDLFFNSTIERMLEHYINILETIVSGEEKYISDIDFLTKDEKDKLLFNWNKTEKSYPDKLSVHECFENLALQMPDATAVRFRKDEQSQIIELTYQQLNNKANKFAHYLKRFNLQKEDLVGIITERSVEMIVAILGVLKAGAAFVPIDPANPKDRISYIINDAAIRLLVYGGRAIDSTSIDSTSTQEIENVVSINIDYAWNEIEKESEANLNVNVDTNNLAYVIYTSGSTGKPKGTMLRHQGLCNLASSQKEIFGLEKGSRVLQFSSLSFDASVWEIVMALLSGAALSLTTKDVISSGEKLGRMLELEEISIVTLPPSVLAVIPQKQLKSLHTIVTAGEAVSKELVNRWSVNRRFFNAYGPTETTVCASIYLCENHPLHKDPPIGRPLNNFKLYVLDKYDQLCGIGIAGELCVEGAGLARGYLKRPELTAEKFIPNPFSTSKGSRLYRTGDLVKYNEDGNIEYLGRIDHQVKVRGFRIELGEIETLLHQNEKIKDVIVTAKEDNLSKKVVAAYYVLKDNEQLSSLELKSYLKKSLPEYMIPSAFICLDKMPLNISGKVDLKALPKIDLSERQSGNEYVAPKTETEETLVSIIESLMNIPTPGILDSFFELGGHSLLATQLISRIREQMHVEIPLRVLFERPVICDLASEIDRVKEEKYGQYSIQKIERKPEGELQSYPLSFAQRRMWFLDQFEPGSPYYNIPMAIKITGTFSVEIFRKVVKEILNRHEALRTTFKEINGIPQQIISRSIDLPFTTIDLRNTSAEEIDSTTARLAREEARKPFDISTGPLFRVSVLLVSETENIVLFTMHHIISDGWSMGVLTKEISFLYKAFLSNEQSPLSELEYQYVDYSYWQKGYLEGEVLNKQLDYWKGQLQGKPPLLELPIDKPRPAVWTNEGTTTSVVIPKELTNSIKKLCQNENSTLFMVLISALNILLYRYCNDEDISVGTPIANRTRKEFENIIGLFINTLVLRTKLEGNPSFLDLLNRVREVTISAYENQDLPFELLVEQLQPDRNMSYPPLFQVMFILQNSPSPMEIVPGITLKELDVEMGTSTTDLTISVSENSSGLDVSVEYNTDLFFSSTIERMLSHYIQILKSISINPLMRVSDISLFDKTENEKIVYQWNSNTSLRPKGAKIHELFEKQVLTSGNNIAVVYNDKKLTYKELNQKANKLAHRLIQLSVKPEQAVAICLDRSTEMMVAVLGVLKSGGAYLPLDSSYPEDRLNFMLQDAKVSVLITQKSLLGILPGYKGNVILIDENWSEIDSLSSENPCIEIDEKNLAYQIYTSGSTGKPKGTMIPHISLVNAALSWQESYELLSRSRNHLQMASFSFDVFSGDWTRALCSGGKLIITPREILLDAEKLYDLMLKEKVNIAEFVPAVLRNLIDYVEKTGRMLDFFNLLIAGSDIWYVGEYRKFRKFCGSNTRLVNSFGLTEATIDSSFYEDDNLSLSDERLVPIGKPFANMKLYILDKYLYPVPIGVRGELYVGGLGVARGYHNRPEVTSERFIPDPFSKIGGERLYKTGDMARFLDDGNIEFLGRIDNQVKLRGFRVELGEIESALTEIEFVKEAVVIAREDKPGNKRLVAYLVLSDKEIKQVNFKKILSDKLPDYMVPSAFVILNSMPLTPNSKVDRKALPIPEDTAGEEIKDNYVSPQNPVEEFIANIWADVLLAENPVGIFSNFFDLGGHSLLAAQVISRIRETFNVDIPLRSIFENPTVASLAKVVERSKAASSGLSIPPIMKVSRDQKLPLSFAQQRLWFLEQLEPDSPFYNIPEIYKIKGEVDFETLQKSLNFVIKRHEVLRTIFISEEGIPRQIVLPEFEVKIEFIDFSSYEEIQKNKAVEEILDKQAKTPIKITEAPLFRFNLIKTEKDEFIVLMIIHHIISDDWSTGIMFREISLTYESLLANSDLELEDLSVQYADYAYWQRDWLKGEILQKQLNYWKNKLEGIVPMISLPVDHARPAVQTFNGSFATFEFSEELSQEVKNICRSEGSTLYMVLMAAFQMLLYKYSGQEDFCIGTPIANRNNTDAEKLIGFFVNTLVIRNDAENKISFSKLLKKVKETSLEAYTYQDIPFEQVVEAVQPVRDLSHSPLFQVMFVIQNAANIKRNIKTTQFQISPVEAHSGTAKFDITLFMLEDNDKIAGAFEYNRDLFERETIEKMIGHYINILKQAVSEPERQISQIGLLSRQEEERLLKDLNKAEQIDLIEGYVHQAFEKQVEKMPEEIAIKTFDKEISYSDLNRYSNILANRLIDKGIRPDCKVAIFLDRSVELVVGLLGILKSGGAYIPVEVSYPKERIRYILEDSKPEIILTKKKYSVILKEFSDIKESNDINESNDLKELTKSKIIYIDEEEGLREEELNGNELNQKDGLNSRNELNPEVKLEGDNLAYIIYTSGSTGKPKGVMITHCGLRSYLSWAVEAYPIREGKGSILHSTIAFDATVTALYPALIMGKSVMILPEGNDIELLGKALLENKDFSLIKITPAHLDILSSQLLDGEIIGLTRSFVIGGENLSYSQIEKWKSNAPETLLFNEYGPTETVVGCIVFEASKALASEGSVPIGRVIPNTRIYVLDEDLRPVGQGLSGELYIGGISLARGYLNKASLTAEKFIADPFSSIPGQRLYRTGDMVRVLKSGDLEFLGRTDSQVKIRGYRIELGEIENVIKETLHLKDALAIVKTESNGSKRLLAFCLKENEDEKKEASMKDSALLRKLLSERLPEYMIPSRFVFLDSFPITSNGKVNRKALDELILKDENSEARVIISPRTADELKMQKIWKAVLNVENISIHDNFFELGGDSIVAMQVIARANQSGFDITVRDLFQNPTIEKLSLKTGSVKKVLSEQGLVTGILPLTPIQNWFFSQRLNEPDHYNQSVMFELNSTLDIKAVHEIFNHIIEHHDALRAQFIFDGKEWKESISELKPDSSKVIEYHDLSAETELYSRVEIICNRLQNDLDISEAPLLRVAYFKTPDELDDLMLIVIHHLVVDAVSWRILFEDLQLSLKQYLQDKEIHLPHKTSSYKIWAEKLIDYSRNNEFIDEVKYWKSILSKDYPEIPRDNIEADNFESSASSLSVSLSKEITATLLSEANDAFRTDINDLLLTALTRSFSTLTGKSRLLINLEAHGRDFPFEDIDVSRTVGWFTNLYPAALDLEGIYETSEAIKAVKEQLRQIPEKGRNFGIIKYLSEDINLRKTFEDLKEPEIIFNYLGHFNSPSSAQDEKTSGSFNISSLPKGKESGDENRRQALIDINGGVYNGQLQFEWSYSNKIHNGSTIKEIADLFIKELENIASYCISAEVGSLSPSDLKKYNIAEETFKKIEKALKDSGIKGYEVEDVYPLSPMQQGMLFHSQLSMGSGTYIEQLSSLFIGKLDSIAFMKAWISAVENHTILRTLFITRGLDEPLQVVKKSIEALPLEIIDLSENGENYDDILNEIKKSEVERGFDYLKAPL